MGPKLLYRWVNIIHPYSQPSDNPEPVGQNRYALWPSRLWIVRGLSIWEDYAYAPPCSDLKKSFPPLTEVKQHWFALVIGWVTALSILPYLLAIFLYWSNTLIGSF